MNYASNDDSALQLELHTERLLLTPLVADDVGIVLEMYTDPEVLKYACDVMTEAEIRHEMSNYTRRGGNGSLGNWCITDRRTGEKVGETYLLPMPTADDRTDFSLVVMGQMPDAEIEIGYFLKRSAWGRGYATEVCQRLLQFAFEEASFVEVVATVDDENVASKKVLEKSGLLFRGRTQCYGKDSPIYGITHDEWHAMQTSPEFGLPGLRSAAGQ